jgi:hypothetical protein
MVCRDEKSASACRWGDSFPRGRLAADPAVADEIADFYKDRTVQLGASGLYFSRSNNTPNMMQVPSPEAPRRDRATRSREHTFDTQGTTDIRSHHGRALLSACRAYGDADFDQVRVMIFSVRSGATIDSDWDALAY